jgi:glutaredoxin
MKNTILLLFLVNSFFLAAQKKAVEFQVRKGNNTVTFNAVNKSDFDQEVTFYFKSIQGLYGYSKPLTKVVPANSKLEFLELRYTGKYSYNYTFRTRAKPTDQQKKDWAAKVVSHNFKEGSQLDEGIVVFSKDGCSRCKLTIDYFLKNDVRFQVINISENKENSQLMWKTLRDHGEKMNRVSTPVILVEGKPHHKFNDLKRFLKKLKKQYP